MSALVVDGVGDDGGHNGPHEADAHHHHHFLPVLTGGRGQGLQTLELRIVFALVGDGELLPSRTDREISHESSFQCVSPDAAKNRK
jgi:hypothetical protein